MCIGKGREGEKCEGGLERERESKKGKQIPITILKKKEM